MAWVKQWDWCVFGKTKGKKRTRDDDNVNLDEYRRPEEKVRISSPQIFIFDRLSDSSVIRTSWTRKNNTGVCCGSTSGLRSHGDKCKVGNRQYHVFTIFNFRSDARSGLVVDDRIRPALESGFAVGSTKPVLLVIDEIDGATGTGENVSAAYFRHDNFPHAFLTLS